MRHTLFAFCAIAILFSCKKDPVQGPPGPAGPQGPAGSGGTGSFIGRVTSYNQYGEKHKTGLNTTTITVVGTTNSVVTDAAGSYTLNNVPQGTHKFTLSRPGSRATTHDQMHAIGNGTFYYNFSMADTATFKLLSGSAKDTLYWGEDAVKLYVQLAPDPKQRYVLALFSSMQNINPVNASSYDSYVMISVSPGGSSSNYLTEIEWMDLPYSSGQKYYVKYFPCAGYVATSYDYLTEKSIFHSTGTPLPTTFTLTMP